MVSMDLILWRHAEAEDAPPAGDDLARLLTSRGQKQAERVGAWLARQLPDDARVLCSPARRCEQTARALGRPCRSVRQLAPGTGPQELLDAAGWPAASHPVVVVGHQPTLGAVVAHLVGIEAQACAVRKGGVWWLRTRSRDGQQQTVVLAVQSPETV
jgi:phosphohistidine phosphatase